MNSKSSDEIWEKEEDGYPLNEYQLTTTPNDFNILTIISFIDSGVFKIPSFQRNYVWDLKRASRLIESLLIGLPIPQIFLYEHGRNEFLVIDGQQRLMTIYYFVKGIFPNKDKRSGLREIFDKNGNIPPETMHDKNFFNKFDLRLDGIVEGKENRFNGRNYETLGKYKTSLELSTIRNMIIKPVVGDKEDEAMFEIFNRLNSGGVNLGEQEIRMSLYHSDFLGMLLEINKDGHWRTILGKPNPDIRLNDVETILRVFAMTTYLDNYRVTIRGFLNKFSNHTKKFDRDTVGYYKAIWGIFLKSCKQLDDSNFKLSKNRFSVMLFESVFYAYCKKPIDEKKYEISVVSPYFIEKLKADRIFEEHTQGKTTLQANVKGRLNRAYEILEGINDGK